MLVQDPSCCNCVLRVPDHFKLEEKFDLIIAVVSVNSFFFLIIAVVSVYSFYFFFLEGLAMPEKER